MELPDELLIQILSKLDESTILKCSLVCIKWASISRDQHLDFYLTLLKQHVHPVSDIAIMAIEKGYLKSFMSAAQAYCDYIDRTIYRATSAHDLWSRSMVCAAKSGNEKILERILSFGPTHRLEEALREAIEGGHMGCAQKLRDALSLLGNGYSWLARIGDG
jgi:hypothetical protein